MTASPDKRFALTISKDSTVHDLLHEHPFLLDFLAQYNGKFALLRNPIARATFGRLATLEKVAGIGELPVDKLIADVERAIGEHAAKGEGDAKGKAGAPARMLPVIQPAGAAASAPPDPQKTTALKHLIKSLHEGAAVADVQAKFNATFGSVSHDEIVAMEEQLIHDGTKPEEIQRLCDVHVAVMKGRLNTDAARQTAPPGHPAHTYRAENEALVKACDNLTAAARLLNEPMNGDAVSRWRQVSEALERVAEVERHYLRKEYQLFPLLEQHGITGPSQVMWGIHDEIRGLLKECRVAVDRADASHVAACLPLVTRSIVDMTFKEDNILIPMALQTLSAEEWARIAKGEAEFGYTLVAPGDAIAAAVVRGTMAATAVAPAPAAVPITSDRPSGAAPASAGDALNMATGLLTLEQLNLLFAHLPIDITFVNERDEVAYFSDTPDRIFPRTPEIIGRKVQLCHPPKSLHVVNRILSEFRSGARDVAEFWIQLKGRMVHIRYFAVRDKEARYRGTIEVTQDVTDIKHLEGQRRLLDWEQ